MTHTYDQQAVSEPLSEEQAFLDALASDPELLAIQQQQLNDDKLIFDAFHQTPTPTDEHINKLLDISNQPQDIQRNWSPMSYIAMAASVLVAVVSVQFFGFSDGGHNQNLSDYAIEHTVHGQHYAGIRNTHPSLVKVNHQLASYGAKTSNVSSLLWNKDCDFEGITSAHLVYQHKDEKINVYIVPASYQFERVEQAFKNDRYHGTIKKLNDNYLIIVAPKKLEVEPFIKQIDKDIVWQA